MCYNYIINNLAERNWLMKEELKNEIYRCFGRKCPIIYINTINFEIIDDLLSTMELDGRIISEYLHGLGSLDFTTKSLIDEEITLSGFLNEHKEDCFDNSGILLLKNIGDIFEEKTDESIKVKALLLQMATKFQNLNNEPYIKETTIIIVSNQTSIPNELADFITILDLQFPNSEEIQEILQFFIEKKKKELKNALLVDELIIKKLSIILRGLTEYQINNLLEKAWFEGKDFNDFDEISKVIGATKKQILKKSNLLEIIESTENLDSIGGLNNLKKWLKTKAKIMTNIETAKEFEVDLPKGILVVGMPGCGKSLTAKACASVFGLQLIRFDIGRLLGKYVGESENNMRKALALAEAISPCVLWIDEIEKAFSGIGSSGGGNEVTTRLFGQFLTWMQEKSSIVFIVATANDISGIPAEFFRRGRFDELFFVDLPNKKESEAILKIHLEKRNKNKTKNYDIDYSQVADDSKKYNGADWEVVVQTAIENSFIKNLDAGSKDNQIVITTQDLVAAKKTVTPIAEVLEDRIKQINEIKQKYHFTDAS